MTRPVTWRAFGHAWIALGLALAIHVADEAMNDFLSLYNPTARALRERFDIPFPPPLSFTSWLVGLSLVIVAWLALSPLAYRGRRWLLPLATIFSVIHLANGFGHCLTSLYLGRPAPGVWSSPVLVATGVWMLALVSRLRRLSDPRSPEMAMPAT